MPVRNLSPRATQAERRERTRNALLESAARGISRYGYGNLRLEDVAREAGYTRGALYHQFRDKEELALAVVEWTDQTWQREIAGLVDDEAGPVETMVAMARGHAVLCRRDIAQVAMALRVEFSGREHPVGQAVAGSTESLVRRLAKLITAGRREGTIPPGPPPRTVARAVIGALEGLVIFLGGQAPHDEVLAERAVLGVLGLSGAPGPLPARARSGTSRPRA